MAELHQIKRLIVSGFRQLDFCDFDFTNPETDEPLSEICLLGLNGTGKTAILNLLHRAVDPGYAGSIDSSSLANPLVLAKFAVGDRCIYQARTTTGAPARWFHEDIESSDDWKKLKENETDFPSFLEQFADSEITSDVPFDATSETGFFGSDSEEAETPPTEDLGRFLSGISSRRDADLLDFLRRADNRDKPVAELIRLFDQTSPGALPALKEVWDKILEPASVRCADGDTTGFVSTITSEAVPFDSLSRGLRRFLLHLGGVFCCYFRKTNRPGYVFLDDPEGGLHPTLQQSLIQYYRSILVGQRTQLFVSTHSPLVAAQFEPYQRIRLSFDSRGRVVLSRGAAPAGADANQMLAKDFRVNPVAPEKEGGKPARYSELKRAIQDTDDQDELADLIDEVMSIKRL